MTSFYEAVKNAIEGQRLIVLATVIEGPQLGQKRLVDPSSTALGSLGSAPLDEAVDRLALDAAAKEQSGPVVVEAASERREVFLEVFAPPSQLVVIGAVHVAIPLVTMAKAMGFRTVVIDPRAAFATEERFPHCDELIVDWPGEAIGRLPVHEATYFAFLSHDPKIDNPGLEVALKSPARYVGALGSKRTHQKRIADLEERGLSAEEIGRIKNPIGLKLGGRRPEEIAVGIAAQLVQARYGLD